MGCRRQGGAEFPDHVALVRKVEVHLDRGRVHHHVEAERTTCRHVSPHDPVAPLRHEGGIANGGQRVRPDPHEQQPQRIADRPELVEMIVDLFTRLMQGRKWRTGEFHLPTGLQRDGLTSLAQAHDLARLLDAFPPACRQALQQPPGYRRVRDRERGRGAWQQTRTSRARSRSASPPAPCSRPRATPRVPVHGRPPERAKAFRP